MNESNISDELRQRATDVERPVELVRWFMARLGDEFDDAHFVFTFGSAFNIPVTVLQRALRWEGFGSTGDVTDDELNEALRPFLLD